MNRGPTMDQIRTLALARRLEIIRALGITDKPDAKGAFLIFAPRRKNHRTPAFAIWTHGGSLAWKDMATDDKGDLFQLVDYMKGWTASARKGCSDEAIAWVKDFLGIDRMTPEQRRAAEAKGKARAQTDKKQADEDLARKRGLAVEKFIKADPRLFGFDNAGARYLRTRLGAAIHDLPKGPRGGDRVPHALRFIAREQHIWQGRKDDPRNGEKSEWPCIVACCTDPLAGTIMAVHRTWLRFDGSDKAPVTPPRKVFPNFAGCIIPLWRGDSGLSVREANEAGLRETVQIGEGWEKSFAMVLANPQHRTWAFISLSNLGNLRFPPCIDSVIVHRDNEWDNPTASLAFEAGVAAIERQGLPVATVRAAYGKDFDDALREGE